MTQPTPYPTDTRPKGWRLELDYERIEQSDTWALALPDVRPWLLMLWFTAWKQTPIGTLPNDDTLIAARIGMPLAMFTEHRHVLMRGWWLAEDGRMYHDTLTERVMDMLAKKEKDRARKENWRKGQKGNSKEVTPQSRVSPVSVPRDSTGVTQDGRHQAPSTKHQAPEPSACSTSAAALSAAEVVKAMRAEGIANASISNPVLLELLAAGVPMNHFVEAAKAALKSTAKNQFGWALSRVSGRVESGEIDLQAGKPKPTPQWAIEAGFLNEFEARNAGSYERNAGTFRDGARIAEVAE